MTVRFGIVGVGGFAATWLRSLYALQDKGIARIAAAVVRSPDKYAKPMAELSTRGCVFYPSLEEMLAHAPGQVDIVGLPTGTPYHASMAILAMETGLPVLVEKPVAATIQEVAALRDAEQRTGQWCAVGYQWIYSPTIQWLRSRIADGSLGSVQSGKTRIGWPRTSTYYGRNAWAGRLKSDAGWVLDGPATNATAHYLTNMTYLASARGASDAAIAQVRAELYRAKPIQGYDTSAIEVSLAGGATLVHLATHDIGRVMDPVMEIRGTAGTVQWAADSDAATIAYNDGRMEAFANPDPQHNHERSFEYIARVLHGEAERPLCGLAEAAPQVLAIDLAFESAGGIAAVHNSYLIRSQGSDGGELVAIDGMEEALAAAYGRGCLFSDLGLPWSRPTHPVSGLDYVHFPSRRDLAASLGVEP